MRGGVARVLRPPPDYRSIFDEIAEVGDDVVVVLDRRVDVWQVSEPDPDSG